MGQKKGTLPFLMWCPSYALGAAGLLPRIDPFGEHCLSRASCAAILIRGGRSGTRRAAHGQTWFWALLPKQKDLVAWGRNPAFKLRWNQIMKGENPSPYPLPSGARVNATSPKQIFGFSKVLESFSGHLSPSGGAVEIAGLEEEGFVHVFECGFFFLDGGGEGFNANWATVKFVQNCQQNFSIHFVEACAVHA